MVQDSIPDNNDNIVDRDDNPADDKKIDPWSAPWNYGYRNLTDAEWQALAESSE